MRLETVFFVLAALMGLVWFQRCVILHGAVHHLNGATMTHMLRLCDELLWVRKQQFEGKDISSLLAGMCV